LVILGALALAILWENTTSKYLVFGSFKFRPLTPTAKIKGEELLARNVGSDSSKRVVLEVMYVLAKVLSIVCVKIMAKTRIIAMEHNPPFADLY